MPFAWALPEGGRYFLAIDSGAHTSASSMRRIVAHELGHALGLRHDRGNPQALMCMPCRRGGVDETLALPPLTERERSQLLRLYAPELPER